MVQTPPLVVINPPLFSKLFLLRLYLCYMQRFIITEEDKRNILGMYGLINEQNSEPPICSNTGCKGTYTGPEFETGNDIAHDYSNVITKAVAAKLKELYKSGDYVKVNFDGIKLSTKGMGTENVVYKVEIPFESVNNKCDARTGFAHVGGWGHPGAGVNKRKDELFNDSTKDSTGKSVRTNPVVGTINDMESSKETSTDEGLVEYWIQWKHSSLQSDCGQKTTNGTLEKEKVTTSTDEKKPNVTFRGDSLNELIKQINQGEFVDNRNGFDLSKPVTIDFKEGRYMLNVPGGKDGFFTLKLALNISKEHELRLFPSKKSLEGQGYKVWDDGTFQLKGEGVRDWALMYKK